MFLETLRYLRLTAKGAEVFAEECRVGHLQYVICAVGLPPRLSVVSKLSDSIQSGVKPPHSKVSSSARLCEVHCVLCGKYFLSVVQLEIKRKGRRGFRGGTQSRKISRSDDLN